MIKTLSSIALAGLVAVTITGCGDKAAAPAPKQAVHLIPSFSLES